MDTEQVKFSELANFFPKQRMAWEAMKVYKYLLYGGAMGGGKSRWLRWATASWLFYLSNTFNIKGLRGGIFCEDYPSLDERQVSKVREEFPSWLATWKDGDHNLVFKPEYGGFTIAFRNLDKPEKYDSTEFAVISIDEIQKNPFNTFKVVRRRLRWSLDDQALTEKLGALLRLIATANPGGEAWVKDHWIDHNFSPEEKEGDQFYFIPSLPRDNPHLSKLYMEQLGSMSPSEQAAYMQGKWDAFEAELDIKGYQRLLSDGQVTQAIINEQAHAGVTILGVDPGAGVDESAIVKKSDICQEVLFNQKLQDVMVLVSLIIKAIIAHQAYAVVIDMTGVGNGVYARLAELKRQRNWKVLIFGVSFGAKSSDPTLYTDLKAELYFKEQKYVLQGGKLVRNDGWGECKIIKFKKDSDDRIFIQPKEELRKANIKSPNVFDAAALTQFVKPEVVKRRVLSGSRPFHDQTEEWWK